MKWTYYNDNDPFICEWVRNQIRAGIAPEGEVDERSITEVSPEDVRGFRRAHFFCGILGWEKALRLSAWPGERPVWTASCPCPPFSVAGKTITCPECERKNLVWCPRRTGFAICSDCDHAWLADARHLWPEVWRLASQCRPDTIFGEQVESSDGRAWLSGVSASMEILGYAVGSSDLPAASVKAPHHRQRLWWVADSGSERYRGGRRGIPETEESGRGEKNNSDFSEAGCRAGRVADSKRIEPGERKGLRCHREKTRRDQGSDQSEACSKADRVGFTDGSGRETRKQTTKASRQRSTAESTSSVDFWEDYEIIPLRDGTQRRTKPGIFPLAHGVRSRTGRLRAYGNAIVPQVAAEFIKAFLEVERKGEK